MRVHTIDLEFQGQPHAIASYLVEAPEGPVLVETGPGSTLQTLLRKIPALGVEPDSIKSVLVTHIHLDHAGAAGWWAQQGATVYVHAKGAPHLVDPSRLIASASRIYGDQMEPLWGEILPAPPDRVRTIGEGDIIEAAGTRFEVIETPGHARHHNAYLLGRAAFTGDAAGMKLPDTPWIDLPAPPPEFDLEQWKRTLQRLRQAELTTLFPTHFGPTNQVAEQLDGIEEHLDQAVSLIRRMRDAGIERAAILERYKLWIKDWSAESGVVGDLCERYEVANPKEMSVDGILRYLEKREP